MQCGPMPILWWSISPPFYHVPVCRSHPLKTLKHLQSRLEFLGKWRTKPTPRFAALSWYLCFYTRKQGSRLVLLLLFVSREAMPPLPNALQAWVLFLPLWLKGAPLSFPGTDPNDLKHIRLWALLLILACSTQPFSFPQSVAWGKSFCVCV